jgi:RimJ/RimL family protein N-acetyltransferase
MVDDISEILWRNQGNLLTPELVAGLLQGVAYALDRPANTGDVGSVDPAMYDAPGPRMVVHDQARVATWVAAQIGMGTPFSGYGAIGLEDADGNMTAGFVIENFTDTNATCHIAGVGRRWLSRPFLFACFDYAFRQLGLKRLTGFVSAANHDALRFDRHLGFEDEFVIKDGCADGDVIMLVMWRDKCRFLRGGHE